MTNTTEFFVDTQAPSFREPTINVAIGPSCTIRCEGCYNHFGDTALRGGLIIADEVLDFANDAVESGVTQSTVSGGDPLLHPEIVSVLQGLKLLGLTVKLDTVGTSLLTNAPIVYKGRGTAHRIDVQEIAPLVDYVNIPLDGPDQMTVRSMRKGRENLFEESKLIATILKEAGVRFGFNTVAHAANISKLEEIRKIAENLGAYEWQVFEYDTSGPNPTNKKASLQLAEGVFDVVTSQLVSQSTMKIVCKSLQKRTGSYFLIDDSGMAWQPLGEQQRKIIGHITRDRAIVLDALRSHISQR